MKRRIIYAFLPGMVLLSCNQSKKEEPVKQATQSTTATTTPADRPHINPMVDGIVGEWQQDYSVIDKNGNGTLDEEERNGTKTRLGFDYFRFNFDGSCLRDKDMKFKGTYDVSDLDTKPRLVIHSDPPGESYRYRVLDVPKDELVLFTDGAFIVFKRIS